MVVICRFVAALAIICGALSAGAQQSLSPLPPTCDAAIEFIVEALPEEDREYLRTVAKEDLIQFHHGWGTGIRNDFGLWGGNYALIKDCATRSTYKEAAERHHPDTVSMVIIEGVWSALQDSP